VSPVHYNLREDLRGGFSGLRPESVISENLGSPKFTCSYFSLNRV